jgi:cyclopropane-fatty-acyl-phospholipid synthase
VYENRLRAVVAALDFEKPFRIVLPNGSEAAHGAGAPAFVIRIKTGRAVRDCLTKGTLGFGEAYCRGDIDVEGDLRDVALLGYALQEGALKGSLLQRVRYLAGLFGRRNTESRAKENIQAHYDLGNDFYSLWLDKEMQYTCAYFQRPDDTLEDAQRQKMDLVCRKLRLAPGELVVEAGCGWGGLALHMARHYGARVMSFNVSKEQVEYARARQRELGIEGIQYVLDDYRNIPKHVDSCDKFVSIGMFEHVGRESYRTFHELVSRVVRKPGLAVMQFIARTAPGMANPWLEKYVFPGHYNPSLAEAVTPLESLRSKLHVVDVENLRYHYALTAGHWLERFERNVEAIRARYGEELVRTFRLYLTGGIADFGYGAGTLIYQVVLANGFDNQAPLTRHHHYQWAGAAAQQAAAPPSPEPVGA